MFGGAGSSLRWKMREAAGIYVSADTIALVRLSAPEDMGGAWMVSESHIAENRGTDASEAKALAFRVHEELLRVGWENLPLAFAVPEGAAQTKEQELPAPLAAPELRDALLWSLRAAADAEGTVLPADICICCAPLPGTSPQRFWTAWMDAARVREYFSSFAVAGLHLRRVTVCPPQGGICAETIARACAPQMPWETAKTEPDELLPAVYAGLLMDAKTPAHLYWSERKNPLGWLRPHAASVIAAAATAAFLAAAGADIASYEQAQRACTQAEEELALRGADLRRMEEFSAIHRDAVQHEQAWMTFAAASSPLRALLVHLGAAAADGIRLTGITTSAERVRIEGEAESYESLSAAIRRMEEQKFFSSDLMPAYAGQEGAEDGRIRFVLETHW